MNTYTVPRPAPLEWPVYWKSPSSLQRLLIGFPIIGIDKQAHRHISEQLRNRAADVSRCWPAELLAVASEVGRIIEEYFRWPNARFVPEDPCSILFWDPTMEMRFEEAMLVLGDKYALPESACDRFSEMNLGDLIRLICRDQKER